jgi:hypothetical protein
VKSPHKRDRSKKTLGSLRLFCFALCAQLICVACNGVVTRSAAGSGNSSGGTPGFGVTLSNGILTVRTHALQMAFQGTVAQYLQNTLTNETLIAAPGAGMLDLNLQNSTGQVLQANGWTSANDSALNSQVGVNTATDSQRHVNMNVGWDSATDEIVLRFDGQSSQAGVRGLLWGLQGFDAKGKFIIPAHAGIYFDAQTNPPQFQFQYPTHWEAQYIIYQSAQGGVILYARDPVPNFKHVQGTRNFGTLDLAVETYAPGPWDGSTAVPQVEWRLRAFQGSWRNAVDTYKAWSATVWPVRAPDSRRDWAKNIQVVITVSNPDTTLLDAVANLLDPTQTLIYLVDWRASPFDANYPDYTPAATTAAFIQYAHGLGFHVMLHTNAVGVATYNSLYSSVSPFQLRDPETKSLIYWPFGVWPAGPPPPPYLQSYAYISPASSAYRTGLLSALKPMMDALQPDALHLDAGGVLVNDGNGLVEGMSSIQGMIRLHQDLSNAYPQVVFGYESMTEALVGFHGFAQRWNADFPAHPISTYMMGSNVKFYGFLDQPNPDEPGFLDFIKRYEGQGILPTITVARSADLDTSAPVTGRVIHMFNLWQQNNFVPDWTADWTGALFRYVSKDGSTKAWAQDDGSFVSLNTTNETVYERVHNLNEVTTSAFINNWPAFDPYNLYGMDPAKEYWLWPNVSRDNQILRLTNLPAGVKLGEGTLATGNYGYFELNTVDPPPFDFMQNFWQAKIGVEGLMDHPLGNGAAAQVSQTQVAGIFRQPVILMSPPSGVWLGGATFAEYQVPIPKTPSTLSFSTGLSDFGPLSDGAIFKITINGTQVWRQGVLLNTWLPAQVDLTPWAGQTVAMRFAVHPGPALNPLDDFCAWGDMSISSNPTTLPVQFKLALPVTTMTPTATAGMQLSATGDPSIYISESPMPAKFGIFGVLPASTTVGQSLLSLPFDVWKQGYEGYPFLFANGPSGQISGVSSGGVTRTAIAAWPADRSLTLLTAPVQIPPDASQLSFSVGLADPPPPLTTVAYTGVDFSLLINGMQVWEQLLQAQGWNDYVVDLTPYRGQSVVITLRADSDGSGVNDWSNWADLTIH